MPRPRSNLEELLLTTAAELIATEGVDSLSLRELGRRAGVSRAAPYHYFTDKAELIARVGALGFRRLGERIGAAAEVSVDPLIRLRDGLLAYIEFARAEPHFFQLMFSGALARERPDDRGEAAGLAFSSAEARGAFATLIDGVRDAQAAGVLRDDDPLLIVNVLWAYTHGIAVLADRHLKYERGTGAVFEAGFNALVEHYGILPP
ncbi:MAG TPA: TetR/AcrR family transcriptional regulator [Thermoanaerobaculia bacterium]|nr:TetR/AcrR family transcriptional regulator [Thermoanaerobaculia bacterium]